MYERKQMWTSVEIWKLLFKLSFKFIKIQVISFDFDKTLINKIFACCFVFYIRLLAIKVLNKTIYFYIL